MGVVVAVTDACTVVCVACVFAARVTAVLVRGSCGCGECVYGWFRCFG